MGCTASITVIELSPEELLKQAERKNKLLKLSQASSLESEPEVPLRTLNAEETTKLLDSALGEIDYFQDWRFGVGDAVINIVNKYDQDSQQQTYLQVANGEMGTVVKVKGSLVVVRFEQDVTFDISQDNSLRPAYALTVNKSQGSEYPVVIVKAMVSWGDKRERFYTAITRAQKKCIVYEVGHSIQECIRARPALRKTYLMKR